MGLVALEGMKFYAFHGYYAEERKIGSWYLVDVYVETNFNKASNTDDLGGTVNYETIFRITRMEMQKSTQLLEVLGQRIINRMKTVFEAMETVRIRITKLNPPMGEEVARAFIEISESYKAECSKCKKMMLVHAPGDCWTKHGMVYPETRATYIRTFGPNVCAACITPYLIRPRETPTEE